MDSPLPGVGRVAAVYCDYCGWVDQEHMATCPVAHQDKPEVVLARLLKRLYPQNPDVVLGREARLIVSELGSKGLAIVRPLDRIGYLCIQQHPNRICGGCTSACCEPVFAYPEVPESDENA